MLNFNTDKFHLVDYVGNYYISTTLLPLPYDEYPYETMVFRIFSGKVEFSNSLYTQNYKSEKDSILGHNYAVSIFKEVSKNE